MINDWAIKKWSKALADSFPLDSGTFLLASIIPLSYIEQRNGENFMVVDLAEIRKYTRMAKDGCDFLVDKGYAKWMNTSEYDKIAIGVAKDFVTTMYYFEKKNRISDSMSSLSASKKDTINPIDIDETIVKLDRWFETYKTFCEKVNLGQKAEKIYSRMMVTIKNVKYSHKITPRELLLYLDCVNAMLYDWTDIPEKYTNKLTDRAKEVSGKTTAENIIKLIPYYVEHYPTIAKKGFEETNIYNLSFHFNTILSRMNGGNRPAAKRKGFGDDKL